jgi:DNA-binding response OmpR family regulator
VKKKASPSDRPLILTISREPSLNYLISRYAEKSGYRVANVPALPPAAEMRSLKPAVIIFASIESLRTAQSLVSELANDDIFILVCSSKEDERRARELGADFCLVHPFTFDHFTAAVSQMNSDHDAA